VTRDGALVARILVLALAAVACAVTPEGPPESLPAPPPERTPFRSWQEIPDLGRLRAAYGGREDFAELCERNQPLGEAFGLLEARSFAELLAVSTPWLESCPVDIDFHLLHAIALSMSGREAEANLHAQWWRGLIQSILASGDGETPQTAWVVISVGEEYAVLRALNLKRARQTLVEGNIDAMEVEGRDGSRILYFDPAAHFRRLEKSLGVEP
jgi:hypothetical protein